MIICIKTVLCMYKHKISLEGTTGNITAYAGPGSGREKGRLMLPAKRLYLELKPHLCMFCIQKHDLNIKKEAQPCLGKHTAERSKHAGRSTCSSQHPGSTQQTHMYLHVWRLNSMLPFLVPDLQVVEASHGAGMAMWGPSGQPGTWQFSALPL